jgi:outer membrane receptor protein involved in Fe transport
MKYPTHLLRGPAVLAALLAMLPGSLFAQSVPTAPLAADKAATDGVVKLAPFEVGGSASRGYETASTTSITGTNVSLDKLPLTAEIFNRTFFEDVAAVDTLDLMMNYAPGVGDPIRGGGSAPEGITATESSDAFFFKLRGLNGGTFRRNGLVTMDDPDQFSLERMEIVRGPQGLLYGATNPSGVFITFSKRPMFNRQTYELQLRADDEGSLRATADANISGKLLGMPVAVRTSWARHKQNYWRDNVRNELTGVFTHLAVKPFADTVVRFEYEDTARPRYGAQPIRYRNPGRPYHNTWLRYVLGEGKAVDLNLPASLAPLSWANVDSLYSEWRGDEQHNRVIQGTVETRITDWLQAQFTGIVGTKGLANWHVSDNNQELQAPDSTQNPTGKWALGFQPRQGSFDSETKAWRATFTTTFNLGRNIKNTLNFGGETKRFIAWSNNKLLYRLGPDGQPLRGSNLDTANKGKIIAPIQWFPVEPGYRLPIFRRMPGYTGQDGLAYGWFEQGEPGLFPVTATDPYGMGSFRNKNVNTTLDDGAFAVLYSDWWDGRLNLLGGLRYDRTAVTQRVVASTRGVKEFSSNPGANLRVSKWLRLFYGFSESFNALSRHERTPLDDVLEPNTGIGHEFGAKFDWLDGRISGSAAYFDNQSKNEAQIMSADLAAALDPAGINGRKGGNGYNYDLNSKGYEISLTARPTRNWRVFFSFSNIDGKIEKGAVFDQHYNDQFNTDAAGQVTFSNGRVHTVRSDPRNAASPLVPLTVAMLRDRNSPYFAELDPTSGRILNAAFLGFTTADPATGATIGTGRDGLPLSAHQLGFVSPTGGRVTVVAQGESTENIVENSFTLLNNYRFSEGPLRGVGVGGSIATRLDQRGYYVSRGGRRELVYWPNRTLVGLFTSYERELGRFRGKNVRWKTQLNVSNLFDKQGIRALPNLTTGLIENYTIDSDPRLFVWTNTFTF